MLIGPILDVQIIKEKNIYIAHSIRPNLVKNSKGYFNGGMLTATYLLRCCNEEEYGNIYSSNYA
jgi:hypothetical protein